MFLPHIPSNILFLLLLLPHFNNLSATFLAHSQLQARLPAVAALRQLIDEYYAPNTESLAISVYGTDRCARWCMQDFMNQLLWQFDGLKVTIEKWRVASMEVFPDRKFNLILVDGARSLELLNPATLTREYDINEYYLVYLLPPCDATVSGLNLTIVLKSIFKYFWRNYIINVSLLLDQPNGTCTLHTFFPFSSNTKCKRVTVRRINSYSNGRWQHLHLVDVFPYKLHNLHKCPLKVAVWDTPPYLSLYDTRTGYWSVGDFEGTMLLELAKKMNFSIDYVVPPNNEQRGKILPNGTATGAMQLLQSRQAELSLGSFRYTLERCQVLTGALPYYQTWQIYGVLLTAQPYTSLEILTFAFDNLTWLCLCLSLQCVCLISYLLYRYQRVSGIARIVLGNPLPQTPLTNIFASFLGYSLVTLPWNTFTRFVLTLWMIFGILLRIAYQSLLFKLLQTNLYREPPHTLAELIVEGYKLVMTEATMDSIYTVPRIQAGQIGLIINTDTSEPSSFAYVESNAGQELLAAASPMDFLTYYVIKEKKRGVFYILPEKIFTQHVSMFFTKHSYLIERFNQLFMSLRSQGMIDYWARQSLDMSYFLEPKGGKVNGITLHHLSGVFVIYLVLLGLAFAVFSVEVAWWRFRVS